MNYLKLLRTPRLTSYLIEDDGTFPNNGTLPLLIYVGALTLPDQAPADIFEHLFHEHHWNHSWRNGIYGYHHYHSTAHEVLGVFSGAARVQFGGENGTILALSRGDVVIVPAGVAHRNVNSHKHFGVVGAYPRGQNWDLCTGKPGERNVTDRNIAGVELPKSDPVYGTGGALSKIWSFGCP